MPSQTSQAEPNQPSQPSQPGKAMPPIRIQIHQNNTDTNQHTIQREKVSRPMSDSCVCLRFFVLSFMLVCASLCFLCAFVVLSLCFLHAFFMLLCASLCFFVLSLCFLLCFLCAFFVLSLCFLCFFVLSLCFLCFFVLFHAFQSQLET